MFHSRLNIPIEKMPSAQLNTDPEETRKRLVATAQRAALENKICAREEAMRGSFRFAKIHEAASIEYEQDALAMADAHMPPHHPITHYMETANSYDRYDERRRKEKDKDRQLTFGRLNGSAHRTGT